MSRILMLTLTWLVGYASSAICQLPIAGTDSLPIRIEVPANVEAYVLGKSYRYLEFTWDQERNAVLVNGILFYAGPAYIPPENEILIAAQNNDYVHYLVDTQGLSWTEAYRVYKNKTYAFSSALYSAAAELNAGSVADSTLTNRMLEFLEAGDYGRLIDLQYGVRVNDGQLEYRMVGHRSVITFSYRPYEGPFGPWRADVAIDAISASLMKTPDVPRIVIFTGGSQINASGAEETARIREQIARSRESGVPENGPLPCRVVEKLIGK